MTLVSAPPLSTAFGLAGAGHTPAKLSGCGWVCENSSGERLSEQVAAAVNWCSLARVASGGVIERRRCASGVDHPLQPFGAGIGLLRWL